MFVVNRNQILKNVFSIIIGIAVTLILAINLFMYTFHSKELMMSAIVNSDFVSIVSDEIIEDSAPILAEYHLRDDLVSDALESVDLNAEVLSHVDYLMSGISSNVDFKAYKNSLTELLEVDLATYPDKDELIDEIDCRLLNVYLVPMNNARLNNLLDNYYPLEVYMYIIVGSLSLVVFSLFMLIYNLRKRSISKYLYRVAVTTTFSCIGLSLIIIGVFKVDNGGSSYSSLVNNLYDYAGAFLLIAGLIIGCVLITDLSTRRVKAYFEKNIK